MSTEKRTRHKKNINAVIADLGRNLQSELSLVKEERNEAVKLAEGFQTERDEQKDLKDRAYSKISDLQRERDQWKTSFEVTVKKLQEENDVLAAFKTYVHDRLDKMGIPADPEPENNASHGCRIEGRINFVQGEVDRLKEQNNKLLSDNDAASYRYNKGRA